LIEDCKRCGTLPFAGLARAGFIAVQILNSMVSMGLLSALQRSDFLNSLDSISSQITKDLHSCGREDFLKKYGHLRPGTYDILSPRYDECPDLYFDWAHLKRGETLDHSSFNLSLFQMHALEKALKEHGLEHDVVGLLSFLKTAIEGREYAKFVFTKSLSDILSLIKSYGEKQDLTTEDMAHINIQDILQLYGSCWDTKDLLKKRSQEGRKGYQKTSQIILPPLICKSKDIWSFEVPENKPNFITHKSVTASIIKDLSDKSSLEGAIVLIPSADPGYDWIFTHNIAGFITVYGGSNSHMAIRASELGLPAVIGAGEKLYSQWSQAKKIHINCASQRVEVVH